MTCQTCRRPTMTWSIVLASPVRMSAERPDVEGPLQGWWYAVNSGVGVTHF